MTESTEYDADSILKIFEPGMVLEYRSLNELVARLLEYGRILSSEVRRLRSRCEELEKVVEAAREMCKAKSFVHLQGNSTPLQDAGILATCNLHDAIVNLDSDGKEKK